jgi:hypothetical protein
MSFYQLLDLAEANRQVQAYYLSTPPVACPNDGTPLDIGPHGELFCKFDGWQYPRDWIAPGVFSQ